MIWMFVFMLLVAWISLFFRIIADIFRDHELSGGAKALWTLFLIFVPWLGTLIYLVVRGGSMNRRAMRDVREHEAAIYTSLASSGTPRVADEVERLAELRDANAITDAEYDLAKARLLA
jgi:hypothetical protein